MKRFKNATLVVAVLGLLVVGWSSPASAHCKPNGPHSVDGHPGCDDASSGDVVLDIEYVEWGGRTHDNHVQIRVQVLVNDRPVEADVIIIVDVCPNDFMLFEVMVEDELVLFCSDLITRPVHFNFPGTTSVDDGERFNIQNAPIGCYITTVDGVLIGGDSIDPTTTNQTPAFFGKSCPII